MPVAEDLEDPTTERRLSLIRDRLSNSAKAHEHRLLRATRPALPVLNWLGQFAQWTRHETMTPTALGTTSDTVLPAYASLVVREAPLVE